MKKIFTFYILLFSFYQLNAQSVPAALSKTETDSLISIYCRVLSQTYFDKAKEKLSPSNLSISEIAYELGFEHSQSFSKLFKTKTNVSPLEFRQSFN